MVVKNEYLDFVACSMVRALERKNNYCRMPLPRIRTNDVYGIMKEIDGMITVLNCLRINYEIGYDEDSLECTFFIIGDKTYDVR